MAETKKTVNPLLIAAIGFIAYVICGFVITVLGGQWSTSATISLASFNRISTVLLVIMLGTIIILSSLGKPTKTIRFVAAGMEALVILVFFLFAWPIARMLNIDVEIIDYLVQCMRVSVIYMLIGSVAAIPIGMWMKDKDLKVQLIVFAAACAVTIGVSYVLMFGLLGFPELGITWNALGFMQPFGIFPFVAALSNAPIKMSVNKTAGEKTSTYSYLEQYKQKMKNGGNKNV